MGRRWADDPAAAMRLFLETEAKHGQQYRACVARHNALIRWVEAE